jgi:serine/threonine-protein kinase
VIGRTISHYRVQERLGGGGMGVVYKAEDTRLNRPVALKFLPSELTRDEDARTRFIQEARAASALEHPNICAVYDIGESPEGASFICMAYCDGVTLKRRMQGGVLPLATAVEWAEQICSGLAKAHEHGIVHRDIKPANVMVTDDGVVKIVDFGLAKLAGSATLTGTGMMVGTAAYVAPEQARGAAVDHRADLWSLGVVLYEMVTGRLPFHAEHVQALLLAVVHDAETPVTELRSDVPAELARVIHRCLRKNPAERYQSAAELRSDLRRIHNALDAGSEPTLSAPAEGAAGRLGRRWLLVAAGAALAAAALLGVPALRRLASGPGLLPSVRHVAVLPLVNVGGEPAGQAFCDGLMETLASNLTQLARVRSSVWVVPASEVRSAGVDSAGEARRHFGVSLAVTGSVQKRADSVRVTLNLVDTASLRQLASAVIDDRTSDLSALQDGAGLELASMLELPVADETRRLLATASTSAPGAFTLYLEGRGALQRFERAENVDAAITAFTSALARDPRYAPAHAGLAEAYFRTWSRSHDPSWIAKAEEACTRALALDPSLAPALVTLGMLRNGTGRYEEAAAALERALALDPTSGAAFGELARAHAALGRIADAESTHVKAIAASPGYWASYNTLGVFYLEQGRFTEAAEQFQKVVELAPDNYWGFNNLGGNYLYLGEPAKARAAFERSLAIEPNYGALSNLGTLAFQSGELDEAARLYRRALEFDKSDYIVWGNLAAACHWGGEGAERAEPLYRRAAEMADERLRVNPRDGAVLADLAAYTAAIGERQRSRDLLDRALDAAPDDPNVTFQAAVTCERLGLRKRALELLAAAMRQGFPREQVLRAKALAALRADPEFARTSE